MSELLILCPGQGSQAAGMAEHLWTYPAARETFAEAGEVLGWDIGELCRHGSLEELTRTDRTQPALLTCSVAVWRLLEHSGASFSVAAGHSLGEYSALVATGHLAFADAVHVVEQRGLAMQACSEETGGAMAAILGLEDAQVEEICASVGEAWLANYNSPGQVVISGAAKAVERAGKLAGERGARRVVPLAVAGAFHTPFMAGAAKKLGEALQAVDFRPGVGRFFSTTENRFVEAGELRDVLARQLTSPVRFSQSMETVLRQPAAPQHGLEVGPGAVLTGLMKRIARDFPMGPTGDADSLSRALTAACGPRAEGGQTDD